MIIRSGRQAKSSRSGDEEVLIAIEGLKNGGHKTKQGGVLRLGTRLMAEAEACRVGWTAGHQQVGTKKWRA